MRNARFRRIGALGCLVLTLTSCTHGSGAGHGSLSPSPTASVTSPTRPSSPSPNPTPDAATGVPTTGPNLKPGEKPPTLAVSGKTDTPEGALAFSRYWFAALDWGYATTSSVLARRLYLPSCTDCAEFMKNFDEPRAKNQHFQGGRSVLMASLIITDDHRYKATSVLELTIRVDALRTLDADENVVASAKAISSLTYRVWLRWQKAGWSVLAFKQAVDR